MRCKGMTLIELLATLSIAAILLSIATPTFSSWITQSRLRAAAYDLFTDIQKSRSEAVKRSARITLWNMADNDWGSGWEIFIDANEDGDRDTGETVLYTRGAQASVLDISGNSSVSSMISYQASGETALASGAFQAGTLTLCGRGINKAYQIVISRGGRPRMIAVTRSAAGCS